MKASLADEKYFQIATFRCNELLVGLELTDVQEINRISAIEAVPHAPRKVRGVINLRGEVATMIDLRVVLDQPKSSKVAGQHNVFVRCDEEVIGLITDGVEDIFTIPRSALDPPPANFRHDSELIKAVYVSDFGELVVILDLPRVLATEAEIAAAH